MYKYLKFDIREGLINGFGRYFLFIVLAVISYIYNNSINGINMWLDINEEKWGVLDYAILNNLGRHPFVFNITSNNIFYFPLEWLIYYILIAICIGGYTKYHRCQFGNMILIYGKSRFKWWCAKCIWIIIVNLTGVILLNGSLLLFSFIEDCKEAFMIHKCTLSDVIGSYIINMKVENLIIICFIIPIIVGSIQSAIQVLIDFYMPEGFSILCIIIILISSCYYHSQYLIYSYSMIKRYWIDDANLDYIPLNMYKGLILSIIIGIGVFIIGVVVIKRKSIYFKNKY